jgi:pyrroloquinoline quinone (PQQ) biosynthesis protein C
MTSTTTTTTNDDGAVRFLRELRLEVEAHPGVNHMFLCRLAHVPFTREDYLVASTQHYPLVGTFTRYLEELLLRAPSSMAKSWLAKVLVDEYGEGSDGKDHRTLYREYLVAAGLKDDDEMDLELHPDVPSFIMEHLRICKEEPFLVGLGAVGPGHEWSIPKMFPPIIAGLRRAGFSESDIRYFTLHTVQDIDHGRWLEEALLAFATTQKNQEQIRRGALLSLEARERFWSGVQDKVTRWRQPKNAHIRPQGKTDMRKDVTLRQLRSMIAV